MKKIIFWNTEHLSPGAADIAEDAAGKLDVRIKAAQTHAASWITRQKPTRATTRGLTTKITKPSHRTERTEVNLYMLLEETRKKAERLRNKLHLSEDLVRSARHTFFCEVKCDHPDARSPLLGGAAAGGATLCYAHYQNAVSTDFSNCPITDGWYVPGGAPIPAMPRVPRGVVINVSRGAAAGQAVRFCFWHAPSGNNGTIVAQMANGLDAGGHPFVLFGDLNAEPSDYEANLAAGVSILRPPGPTRISGRILDYAVTNRPDLFHACRPLYTGEKNYEIKQKTGSDHMVMIFELK